MKTHQEIPTAPTDVQRISEKVIYVVDDDEVMTSCVALILNNAGFTRVLPFTQSYEVFQLIQRTRPDLIITDIHMPELSGTMLSKIVNSSEKKDKLPILAITADDSPETFEQAFFCGVFDVVHKPLNPEALVRKVEIALEWYAANNDRRSTDERRAKNLLVQREATVYEAFRKSR